MQTDSSQYARALLALFAAFILAGGQSFIVSAASICRARGEEYVSSPKYDPNPLVQIWYDPREPDNSVVLKDHGREICWDGMLYDVVSASQSDEETLYLCRANEEQSAMLAHLAHLRPQQSPPKGSGLGGKIFLEKFVVRRGAPALQAPDAERRFAEYHPSIKPSSPEFSPPPPRSV